MKESVVVRDGMWAFAHYGFQVLMPGWKTPYDVPFGQGVVWRNNVGGMRDKTGRHFVRFGVNGMPDIMGFTKDGLTIGAEAKVPGEKPTELQEWFGEMMTRAGGIWFWFDSYDSCAEGLKKNGFARSQ